MLKEKKGNGSFYSNKRSKMRCLQNASCQFEIHVSRKSCQSNFVVGICARYLADTLPLGTVDLISVSFHNTWTLERGVVALASIK